MHWPGADSVGWYSLVVHGHEVAAPDPGHHRVHDAKTEHDSDGGVHGATPMLRHDITEISKNWKSVRITHAGSWMVCKQYIVLNHVLSKKQCISEANC